MRAPPSAPIWNTAMSRSLPVAGTRIVLDHRTSDRAPLFSANQLVPSHSERGHCAAITRSAPGNASPVPDPKRTAKPTNRIGKGARNQGADGSRCYGQPRSYLTGWKSSSLNFLSIGGRYSRSWVNSPSPTAKRIAARITRARKGSSRCPFWQIGPNRSAFPDRVKSFPDQRI